MTPLERFKLNVAEVEGLINFDREVLQVAISAVESLHNRLKDEFADERKNGQRALQLIKGIRDNDSVRGKYKAIYNQSVVLLVSHFASALGNVFREAVTSSLASQDSGKLLEEEFRLTVADLKERNWSLKEAIPDLLIAKYDFTFQDMKATGRAFQEYTKLTIPTGECMNNIIVTQACRHVIVHAGGSISDKTKRQVAKAFPRSLKIDLANQTNVSFELQEIDLIKNDMLQFIQLLTESEAST
jgi:hypothetical protein